MTEVKAAYMAGLHDLRGNFRATQNANARFDLYRRGALRHPKGTYYLAHADGAPFFWAACTAWNGALKSTNDEWDRYLSDRVRNGYSVIQLVTTQWRGQDVDENGDAAFEGAGRIRINAQFFQRLDRKMDRINEHGLLAAPALLWALQQSSNRGSAPAISSPIRKLSCSRATWSPGTVRITSSGCSAATARYNDEYEQRWKSIGRGVFGTNDYQGVVATHSQGKSWIGRDTRASDGWR